MSFLEKAAMSVAALATMAALNLGVTWYKSSGEVDVANGAATVIKESIRSPATYSQVSSKTLWKGKDGAGDSAYVARVEYDAQNGFGALIRDCQFVAFRMKGDQVMWHKSRALAPCDFMTTEKDVTEWQVRVNEFHS